jgi:acetyl esterase/lipase
VTVDPLDPELATMLDAIPAFTVSAELVDVLQAATRAGPPVAIDGVERTEHVVDAARGVVVRIHTPSDATEPRPGVFSIHGGGYVFGSRDLDDAVLARWAVGLGVIGISVEYRLAPQTSFPGPLDDCDDAYRWVHEHADELGIDRSLLGVAGTSAGGGLAIALALLARERGTLMPAFLVLDAPMIDDRQRSASSRVEDLPIWNRESNEFGWRAYLGDRHGGDDVPPLAAPARAVDLSGLPPTFVGVGTVDGFRDEVVDFASRLDEAGVPTELHEYPGAPHGFQLFADSALGRRAARDNDEWLARRLGVGSAG